MAVTPSTMLALGTRAPGFTLTDAMTGGKVALDDLEADRPLLVMFLCNHCPFVIHVREEIARIGSEYAERGVSVVAVNSNDVATYPEDSPERMREMARESGWTFPYLFDETQEVAKSYRAACTPDFFLFDRDRALVYRGQMDGSRPGNDVPNDGRDLRAALDAVLTDGAQIEDQRPSMGCNIKWRPGNEPDYYG
jgi:thiol-disulfide isomerase/thioredoxin